MNIKQVLTKSVNTLRTKYIPPVTSPFIQGLREVLKREEFSEIRRKRSRAGKTKISISYLNVHGKNNLLRIANSSDLRALSAHSLTFLSET